jgi:hypothetical protein
VVLDDVQSGGTKYFEFVDGIATDPLVSVASGDESLVVQALHD